MLTSITQKTLHLFQIVNMINYIGELVELETAHPDEILPESPTHRVGGVVLKALPNTSTSIPL